MATENPESREPTRRFQGDACVLESNVSEIDADFDDEVIEHISAFGFDADESERLGILIREAAINGMKHGNGEDPSKKVAITLGFDRERKELVARITDEGSGFDLDAVPEPTSGERIMDTHGRGVFLMRAWCDGVRTEGSTLILTKKLKEKPA